MKPCCADLSGCLRSEQVVKEFSSSLYVRGRHLSQMEISFTKGKTGTLFLELFTASPGFQWPSAQNKTGIFCGGIFWYLSKLYDHTARG